MLGSGGCWLFRGARVPAEVREIRTLVDEQIAQLALVARNEVPLSFDSPEMEQILDRARDLPEEQRELAGREVGRLLAARERAEMDSYFALPPEARPAELDRRIRAEEARRQAREDERQRRMAARPASSQPPPSTRVASPFGPPGSRQQGRGRAQTEDERNARSKRGLDRSYPEQRARRTEYRRLVAERRQQLGLPSGRR